MEKMPFHPQVDSMLPTVSATVSAPAALNWHRGLPSLTGALVSLRELRLSDAPSLFAALTGMEVSRFISPPPHSVDGFEEFIAWTHRQREAGHYLCFAVMPKGSDSVIGLFQVRSLEPAFGTAEWGFAIASEFWGTGMFLDGARLVLDFAFGVIGVHRMEARSTLRNSRGNGALRKLGAVQEGVLRRSFLRNGEYLDQSLWTIMADDRLEATAVWGAHVIH
jgi:ribosomal-protein-alanine N-acetyltransferase